MRKLILQLAFSLLVLHLVHGEDGDIRVEGCVFPFTYKGKTYEFCTSEASSKLWCSKTAVYSGSWMYCNKEEVDVDDSKDKFADVFKKLDENSALIKKLQEENHKLKTPKCGCQDQIDNLSETIEKMKIIIKDHERRDSLFDKFKKQIKNLDDRLKSIEISYPDVLNKVLNDPLEKKYCQGNHCAYLVRKKKKWMEAEEYCRSNFNGHLASIHTAQQQAWLQSLIIKEKGGFWYVGLSDYKNKRHFTWTDGSPYDYSQFDTHQPDNHMTKEHCVHLNFGKGWNDLPCDRPEYFICMKQALPSPPAKVNEKLRCFCGNCYVFVKTKKSFEDALSHCRSLNGNLASVHSTTVLNWVHHTLRTEGLGDKSHPIWWNSLTDKDREGHWINTDGSPYDFKAWAAHQPDNAGNNEDCGHFTPIQPPGWSNNNWANHINDVPCSVQIPFVCKLGQPFYNRGTYCH